MNMYLEPTHILNLKFMIMMEMRLQLSFKLVELVVVLLNLKSVVVALSSYQVLQYLHLEQEIRLFLLIFLVLTCLQQVVV